MQLNLKQESWFYREIYSCILLTRTTKVVRQPLSQFMNHFMKISRQNHFHHEQAQIISLKKQQAWLWRFPSCFHFHHFPLLTSWKLPVMSHYNKMTFSLQPSPLPPPPLQPPIFLCYQTWRQKFINSGFGRENGLFNQLHWNIFR